MRVLGSRVPIPSDFCPGRPASGSRGRGDYEPSIHCNRACRHPVSQACGAPGDAAIVTPPLVSARQADSDRRGPSLQFNGFGRVEGFGNPASSFQVTNAHGGASPLHPSSPICQLDNLLDALTVGDARGMGRLVGLLESCAELYDSQRLRIEQGESIESVSDPGVQPRTRARWRHRCGRLSPISHRHSKVWCHPDRCGVDPDSRLLRIGSAGRRCATGNHPDTHDCNVFHTCPHPRVFRRPRRQPSIRSHWRPRRQLLQRQWKASEFPPSSPLKRSSRSSGRSRPGSRRSCRGSTGRN